MNLAEIRKKAQKEQQGSKERADLPLAVPEECEPEAEEPIQGEADILDGLAVPPCREETETGVATAPEDVPTTFDPVAVLMAGREAFRTDMEALESPETGSVAAGDEFQEFLCFRVSSEIYAINIMAIKEIIKPREVTEIPRAPEFVSGVLSLRGIIIPVFNMRKRLGLSAGERSGRERIIVVKKGEEFMGIVVDEVTQVVRITATTIEKPPAVLDGIDRDFVSGIGRCNNQMLILLNQDKILDISLGQAAEGDRI
ncbi:MAG TPA: chemotaxis protein CheW [Geobacteraceae bacterium]|nr:chemotaxis protein CheW [Geobacteraceae bacterium]